jgi:spore cortex protein
MAKKKTSFLAVAVLATGVLAACNADNDDMLDNNYGNETRPIGYYSNDRDVGFNNNNANDGAEFRGNGPIPDLMNNDGNRQNNRTLTNNNNGDARYADGYDGELAERIENRVENINYVEEAQVIVTDDSVLVGVDTNDKNDKNVEKDVRSVVQKLTNKQVRVANDEDSFNRMGDITDDLRNGKAFDEVQSDVTNIVNDLGDAVQRPFQNNR